MRWLAALLILTVVPARAELVLPSDFLSEADMRRFQLCRAATFYHLHRPPEADARVPQAVARTILDQINFVIFESLTNKPIGSIADGQRLLTFTENWILAFSRVIREEEAALSDPATRERVLLDCVPVVWGIARDNIDHLMEWRLRATDPVPFGPMEERHRRVQETIERLLTGR